MLEMAVVGRVGVGKCLGELVLLGLFPPFRWVYRILRLIGWLGLFCCGGLAEGLCSVSVCVFRQCLATAYCLEFIWIRKAGWLWLKSFVLGFPKQVRIVFCRRSWLWESSV